MEGYNPNPGDILYVDFDGNGIINNGKNTSNETRRHSLSVMILADINTEFVVAATWKGISCHFILQRSRQTGSLAHERTILSTLRCLLNFV